MSDEQMKPLCCVIGCFNEPEFDIYGESGHPEDSTQACESHVGVLLGTPEWLAKDNRSWSVVQIIKGVD